MLGGHRATSACPSTKTCLNHLPPPFPLQPYPNFLDPPLTGR